MIRWKFPVWPRVLPSIDKKIARPVDTDEQRIEAVISLIGLAICRNCGTKGLLVHRPEPGRPNNLICETCGSSDWHQSVSLHR